MFNQRGVLSVPAAAAGLSPLPSVGLCLSQVPPGGHTPAAASCCSPAALSGSDHVLSAAPSGSDRAPLAALSVAFESECT